MSKKILIDAVYSGETRVAIYDQNTVQDFDYENRHKKQLKGNIYLAKITRVEPSLQAAFVEYGGEKHGFLPFSEINPSYFLKKEEPLPSDNTGASIKDKIQEINLVENLEDEAVQDAEESIQESDEAQEEESDEENIRDSVHQKYKIQDVIKKGQVILIQIIKEERGNKGASCTSYISLAGRYCVFMPNSDRKGGVSRRIVNIADRRYLRKIMDKLHLPEGASIILRTAGAGKNLNEIKRDYVYLARLWNAVREHTISAKIGTFIHAESDLLKRTIRDLYSSEVSEILIQGSESFKTAKEFMKKILPLHAGKVKEYKSKVPIFTKFNIEQQASSLYSPIVHLPSGGYIVMNSTEALTAIDVNSGKATTEKNIEETATKTNVEAAIEVARQLRLRDLSGLIVIDFIDMLEESNRRLVERSLRDAFQTDRAKVQLGNISAFGLLELSRQRLQSSFAEANTIACPACSGRGHIKSFDSNALVILRTIESEASQGKVSTIDVYVHPDIMEYLLNNRRQEISNLENLHRCKIIFHRENTVHYDGFAIEKVYTANNEDNNKPKLTGEEHMDSYSEESLEDSLLKDEDRISPYQVNDHSIIDENAPMAMRHRVHQGGKKRKIHKGKPQEMRNDVAEQPNEHKQHKANKFKNRNRYKKQKSGNTETVQKKSMLKGLWDRLTG